MEQFARPHVSRPETPREARTPFAGRIVIHATAAETGGAVGLWDTHAPPGLGPAPHLHTRETEIFRVIRGLYWFRCGGEEFTVGPEAVVVLPPHVEHAWRNVSDGQGQMFAMVIPGGFEGLFAEIAATDARTDAEIAAIEVRYGIVNAATRALGF